MNVSFDGGRRATVTDDPLRITPRFTTGSVCIAPYTDVREREQFLADTFGSQDFLWDFPDVFRFTPDSGNLVGVELQLPYTSWLSEVSTRLPDLPAVRPGGLRTDEVQGFRHEMCAVLCRAPEDAALICLRDPDVLERPLDARIGIAPDVTLLVQHDTVVGWTVSDPVRYLTTGFAAPDPGPPAPATRRLFTECLDLITTPVIDDLVDGEPAALARLHAADKSLRAQQDDRHRADALLEMIATYVEDYGRLDITADPPSRRLR
ncbi:hypothetical protein ACVNF4_03325 [Streptomyces sp. S6]